jgi:hypothetical protein
MTMVSSLSKAIEAVSSLPSDRQEQIANLIMGELQSESKWEELFSQSHDMLAKMAEAACTEHETGETTQVPTTTTMLFCGVSESPAA